MNIMKIRVDSAKHFGKKYEIKKMAKVNKQTCAQTHTHTHSDIGKMESYINVNS